MDYFRIILGIILDVFGDHVGIILEAFWKYFGAFGGHFGVILGLGTFLRAQEGPKSAQERQNVDFGAMQEFPRAPKEVSERSESVQNRSRRLQERPRRAKGDKSDEFGGPFGGNFGVIWGFEKCPRKKRVEKVKIVFSCRRHADFRGKIELLEEELGVSTRSLLRLAAYGKMARE